MEKQIEYYPNIQKQGKDFVMAAKNTKDPKEFELIEQELINKAVEYESPYVLLDFTTRVKGAHINKFVDALELIAKEFDEKDGFKRSAIAYVACEFASKFNNVDIQKLQQIVMDMGRPHAMLIFANRVDDVDLEKLKSANMIICHERDKRRAKMLNGMTVEGILKRKQEKLQAVERLKNAKTGDLSKCTLEEFAKLVEYETSGKLSLAVRSYNCLKRGCINTLSDLIFKTDDKLLKIRAFRRRELDNVKDCLAVFGLSLKGEEISLEEDPTLTLN